MAATGAASWSFGGRSVMGASHVHHGIPNQDAIAWSPRAGRASSAVLTLADGHGASPHFRSGTGAHMAVEIATAVLTEALVDASWIASKDEARAIAVTREIIGRWRTQVLADVAKSPLGPAAMDPFTPYGTTLIAAAVAPEGLFLLQLGDGDLLLGTRDGAILRPLPDDVGLIGQETYSLCQSEAEALVRTQVLTARDADVDFVMLSTDGLAKSFRTEPAFRRHAASWRSLIGLTGLPDVLDRLDLFLSSASGHGSRDDMTLGFIARDLPAERSGLASWLRSRVAPGRTANFANVQRPGPLVTIAATLFLLIGLGLAGAAGYFLTRWLL